MNISQVGQQVRLITQHLFSSHRRVVNGIGRQDKATSLTVGSRNGAVIGHYLGCEAIADPSFVSRTV
ncbi:MAG: hypothetical protein MH252_04400 [Thermosynechococcaceae cyanobacterium MS004]|nr:hypothetical protein [Thermosynechococcaceae cyanobacterium MS004]